MPTYFKQFYIIMLYYDRFTATWKNINGLDIWFKYDCKCNQNETERFRNLLELSRATWVL
jgi:hypothetical protein